MITKSNEKRVHILEGRQQQPDFVPAEWISLEEGARRNDIHFAAEEASGVNIEEREREHLAAGWPLWMIQIQRENRQDYYERKAKREAEAQKKATDNYLSL